MKADISHYQQAVWRILQKELYSMKIVVSFLSNSTIILFLNILFLSIFAKRNIKNFVYGLTNNFMAINVNNYNNNNCYFWYYYL